MQADALRRVTLLFTNEFRDDNALLAAVRGKMPDYRDVQPEEEGAGGSIRQKQAASLQVLVHTFKEANAADVALRAAALEKLGRVGSREDAAALLPLVRRPPHSADLYNGLEAIHAIAEHKGSPFDRGKPFLPQDLKDLLGRPSLNAKEETRAIEGVLKFGKIKSVVRNGARTQNPTYVVTFEDSLPGPDGTRIPIQAIWKPEWTTPDKQQPNFSREVSAYVFARDFAKSNIVPVTVEAILSPDQIPGGVSGLEAVANGTPVKPWGVGSLQYRIPNAESMGLPSPEMWRLKPKFEEYLRTPSGQKQIREIQTHLYALNDPEHLPNSGGYPRANWGNIIAVPDGSGGYKLYVIDNGTGQGSQTQFDATVNEEMLPTQRTQAADNLARVAPSDVAKRMGDYIDLRDAADVAKRVRHIAQVESRMR